MIRREKKKKNELLSDKISNLFTVAPSADVEDDRVYDTKPTTVTRDELASDDDLEEATLSAFRKRNVALLSELNNKYAGEVSGRKRQLEDDDDDDDDVEASEEEQDSADSNEVDEEDSTHEIEEVDDAEESDLEQDDSDLSAEESEEGFDISQLGEGDDSHFEHIKETDKADEINKGTCVKNQLNLWENLLETRISLQKCLVTANKLPLTDTFKDFRKTGGSTFDNSVSKAKGSLINLLSRLLDLQSTLLGQFSETKNLLKNVKSSNKSKQKQSNDNDDDDEDEEVNKDFNDDDDEITSDSDTETKTEKSTNEHQPAKKKQKLNDFSEDIGRRHVLYAKYRNSVIQKWNDKTKVNTIQRKNQQPAPSTVAQIEFLLADKNKLIKRTQLKRSKYDIVGEMSKEDTTNDNTESNEGGEERLLNKSYIENEEYCTEIFDDDDFYHQLLRELIEYKSADISDPIQLSRQWIALQQLRSKMKRKIDTRATKGRRIRYAVHSKLVNFMAADRTSEWTDESKNELFASLFGKQYESAGNGNTINLNGDNGLTIM